MSMFTKLGKCYAAILALPLMVGGLSGAMAQRPSSVVLSAPESAEAKIKRALSAAPAAVAMAAAVAEIDGDGKTTVLRAGTNGFTCVPGDPKDLSKETMCMDGPSMQWFSDYAKRRPKPTNTVPGITYMLAGGTQRSDSEPYDKTSPLIEVGPHWMIMWPLDSKTTLLPTKHKPTGTYIKWAGSPYAYLVVTGKP